MMLDEALSVPCGTASSPMVDAGVFPSVLDEDRVRVALIEVDSSLVAHCIE